MIKLAYILLCIKCGLLSTSVETLDKTRLQVDSLYNALAQNPNDSDAQIQFFNALPCTLDEFNLLYNYDPSDTLMMYQKAHLHIFNGFGKLDKVPGEDYYQKLVGLALCEFCQSDVPNLLQSLIRDKAKENPDMILAQLRKLTGDEVYTFGTFIFSGTYQGENGMPEYFDRYKVLYTMVHAQLQKAYFDTASKRQSQ